MGNQEPAVHGEPAEEAAGNLISLIPLYHSIILKNAHGISGFQAASFRVLNVLSLHGVQRMSEIGRRLYISKPYMTALIDGMIAQGYVKRQPDPDDRRVIRIMITDKGRSHLSLMATRLKNDIRTRLSVLGERDLELLSRSLFDLRRVLEKISER